MALLLKILTEIFHKWMSMIEDIKNYKDFEEKLDKLNLSEEQFAKIIGYTPDAFRKWRMNDKVPKWIKFPMAFLLMLDVNEPMFKRLCDGVETVKQSKRKVRNAK